MNVNAAFQWQCQPEAEHLIVEVVEQASRLNPFVEHLQRQLLEKTSTRLFDWLDHVVIRKSPDIEKRMEQAGYMPQGTEADLNIYHHPGAQLPRIVLKEMQDLAIGLALSVDSIADFLMVRGGIETQIEGTPLSGYRRCCVSSHQGVCLWVVERRGAVTMQPVAEEPEYIERYIQAREKWQDRLRGLEDEEKAMQMAIHAAQELVKTMGKDRAAWIVLECEREYWQARNTAGQLQKNRQDRLGMGWANHDHHTFRSSRHFFTQLVHLFEILGFHCRERFYAGEEAGWGAQVMENPNCRLVLFLDVDLAPGEIEEDFAHQPLSELPYLGTIGLWCALHGDSILKAGMHHLEAQFMFTELEQDLAKLGIHMMNPFSSFPYLKQAFTEGERWPVDSNRIKQLAAQGKITQEQAYQFQTDGAIGSHLENLQRREGYKGFNQKNVSIIIKETDPRRQKKNA